MTVFTRLPLFQNGTYFSHGCTASRFCGRGLRLLALQGIQEVHLKVFESFTQNKNSEILKRRQERKEIERETWGR